jgi:hypothetical protein
MPSGLYRPLERESFDFQEWLKEDRTEKIRKKWWHSSENMSLVEKIQNRMVWLCPRLFCIRKGRINKYTNW